MHVRLWLKIDDSPFWTLICDNTTNTRVWASDPARSGEQHKHGEQKAEFHTRYQSPATCSTESSLFGSNETSYHESASTGSHRSPESGPVRTCRGELLAEPSG